jgi:hypothetical protein
MGKPPIEKRVAVLEQQLVDLKRRIDGTAPWWERIAGTFADDPAHEQAAHLGESHRKSLRPRPKRRRQ